MKQNNNDFLREVAERVTQGLHEQDFTGDCYYKGYDELKTHISMAMPGYYIFVFDYTDTDEIAELLIRFRDATDVQFVQAAVDDFAQSFIIIAIKP